MYAISSDKNVFLIVDRDCVCVCVRLCMCMCVYMCACVCVCLCVACMCLCLYLYGVCVFVLVCARAKYCIIVQVDNSCITGNLRHQTTTGESQSALNLFIAAQLLSEVGASAIQTICIDENTESGYLFWYNIIFLQIPCR